MNLEETIERLEREGLEYAVTELEPIDGTAVGRSNELRTHIVQYYNRTGDDITLMIVEQQCKVVCLSGYFNQPIEMKEAF